MPARSLSIVLPAYNEEARLGPALDELFGYLHRRGAGPRRPAGPRRLPERIQVLVVDDGSTDGTADLVRARPEAHRRRSSSSLTVPHGGKGAAVQAGMLAADGDLVIFTDADMATPPDEIPLLVDALDDRRRRVRQPDPARRLRHAGLAAGLAAGAGQDVPRCWRRCGSSARCRTRSAGSRGSAATSPATCSRRQKVTSIVFDVEVIFLVRRRGYTSTVVPIRWADRRGSRMHPGLRLAIQVAWDLFRIPLLHRDVKRVVRGASDQPAT